MSNDLKYVEFYARELKKNPQLFKQHKMLIDSQIQNSALFFQKLFAGTDFKKSARKYLRSVGLI